MELSRSICLYTVVTLHSGHLRCQHSWLEIVVAVLQSTHQYFESGVGTLQGGLSREVAGYHIGSPSPSHLLPGVGGRGWDCNENIMLKKNRNVRSKQKLPHTFCISLCTVSWHHSKYNAVGMPILCTLVPLLLSGMAYLLVDSLECRTARQAAAFILWRGDPSNKKLSLVPRY